METIGNVVLFIGILIGCPIVALSLLKGWGACAEDNGGVFVVGLILALIYIL